MKIDTAKDPAACPTSPNVQAAALVIAAGVVAALHVGKLPPVIPVLRTDLGVTLVQGGFLLAIVQMAGMILGVFAGSLADRLGPRRVMLLGLGLLAVASMGGALAHSATLLLATRAVEGLGFLLTVLPAPGLVRRFASEPRLINKALGFWGAYMPIGTASALLIGPWAYGWFGWRASWVALGLLTLFWGWLVWRKVPADARPVVQQGDLSVRGRLRETLGASGPWLVASAFFLYSGQWLAVVGFLPTIYTQAGWSVAAVGGLSALAAGINLTGNIAAGRLLAKGVRPFVLLTAGYTAMALGAVFAFGGWVGGVAQYLAVLLFSSVGGLVPGTLFALAVRLAPSGQTVSTTVGWVQQLSALGQFLGPPLVAWLAARAGGWQYTWTVTVACCMAGVLLANVLQRQAGRVKG